MGCILFGCLVYYKFNIVIGLFVKFVIINIIENNKKYFGVIWVYVMCKIVYILKYLLVDWFYLMVFLFFLNIINFVIGWIYYKILILGVVFEKLRLRLRLRIDIWFFLFFCLSCYMLFEDWKDVIYFVVYFSKLDIICEIIFLIKVGIFFFKVLIIKIKSF